MNCFQIVILRSLTQSIRAIAERLNRCELLSNCDFTIFDTVSNWYWLSFRQCCELLSNCDFTIFDTVLKLETFTTKGLWIAFKLWFYDLWHSSRYGKLIHRLLWIAFKLWFYDLWHSFISKKYIRAVSCELLSNCDFTIFDTVLYNKHTMPKQLWIAFKLWFYDLWHSVNINN